MSEGRRRPPLNPLAATGLAMIALYALLALAAPWVAPYRPTAMHTDRILEAPSRQHLFGTDEFGRDVLSRLLYGTRSTLAVAAGAVLLALLVGVPVGTVSGFFGRGLAPPRLPAKLNA